MFTSRRITTLGGDKFRDEYSLSFPSTGGSNDYIDYGNNLNLGTSDFTMTAWVKAADFDATYFLGKHQDADNRWYFGGSNNDPPRLKFHSEIGGSALLSYLGVEGELDNLQNTWVHFAISADRDGNIIGYINGVLDDTDSADNTDIDNTGDLHTSRHISSYSNQTISEIAVYDKALSASEVKTIYNGREPFNHKESSFASNLTNWWRMGDGRLDDTQILDQDGDRFGVVANEVNAALDSNLITDADGNTGAAYGGANITEDSTEQAYDGTESVKFVPTSSDDGIRYTAFTTVTGKIYKASVFVYTTNSGNDTLRLKLREGDGSGTARYADFSVPSANTWYQYTTYFKETSGGSGAWFIVSSASATSGTYYADSPSFQLVEGEPGVLLNTAAGDTFTGDTP